MKDDLVCLLTSAFCLLAAAQAPAQDPSTSSGQAWPSRTVRFVVPSSPGGGTDTYARFLAQGLGHAL